MKTKLMYVFTGAAIGFVTLFSVSRCGSDDATVVFKQIERLGRPVINEGLVLTNDALNIFNTIAPMSDLTPTGASPIGEAAAVLGLIYKLAGPAGLNIGAPTVANVVGGFLPDIMRIDTLPVIATGNPSYGTPVNNNIAAPIILVGGRKVTDHSGQITLSYLFTSTVSEANGNPWSNGVSYYGKGAVGCPGANGTNPSAPGHHCLNGQAAQYGAATFPFLAAAN